jgi:hypothetical protein
MLGKYRGRNNKIKFQDIFDPEVGVDIFLRNICGNILDYTVSGPRQ